MTSLAGISEFKADNRKSLTRHINIHRLKIHTLIDISLHNHRVNRHHIIVTGYTFMTETVTDQLSRTVADRRTGTFKLLTDCMMLYQ